MNSTQVTELLRSRRAVFPNMYVDKPIAKETISTILENANWAPTHRLTEPWRFKVFHSEKARQNLSDYLGNWYENNTPEAAFSPMKLKKTRKKPMQSGCVIAICMQRDADERVPEWEEIAATAMAVQNMWLTCSAEGIGCYWSSPKSMLEAAEFLGLEAGERCLGVLYMGYYEGPELPGKRQAVAEKVSWA